MGILKWVPIIFFSISTTFSTSYWEGLEESSFECRKAYLNIRTGSWSNLRI